MGSEQARRKARRIVGGERRDRRERDRRGALVGRAEVECKTEVCLVELWQDACCKGLSHGRVGYNFGTAQMSLAGRVLPCRNCCTFARLALLVTTTRISNLHEKSFDPVPALMNTHTRYQKTSQEALFGASQEIPARRKATCKAAWSSTARNALHVPR